MLEQEIVERLISAGKTVAVAESCTGGLIGGKITAVSGSSACFVGGIISYSNELKQELLGVGADILKEYGAVSEPVAKAMAERVRRSTGSDYSLSVTGIAGPGGGTEDKPVGLVYIGLAGAGETVIRRLLLEGDRSAVRESAVEEALKLLMENLETQGEDQDG